MSRRLRLSHITIPETWQSPLQTNVTATATLITCVAPLLEVAEDGKAIFFDDSRAGEQFFSVYGATKAARSRLSDAGRRKPRAQARVS